MQYFRFIDSGACTAEFNMALDEAIAMSVANSSAVLTLRLYKWRQPSVSIGAFQKISDIDTNFCQIHNIPIVRRITGGKAILHDSELTYSVCGKNEGIFSKSLFDTYMTISLALQKALNYLGVKTEMREDKTNTLANHAICFNATSFAEIMYNKHKLIGSAQKRFKQSFLQHGSIPYSIDKELHLKVFGYDITDCSCLADALNQIDEQALKHSIIRGFEDVLQLPSIQSDPTEHELNATKEIASKRYSNASWTNRF